MKILAACQRGYEEFLKKELVDLRNIKVNVTGDSFLICNGEINQSVFAHYMAYRPVEIKEDSVNQIGGAIYDYFFKENKDKRIESSWPCVFLNSKDIEGLSRRASSINDSFKNIIKKRMSRVSKLAVYNSLQESNYYEGLLVFVNDFKKAYVATDFIFNGQRRMADNPDAPSRSFLKVEEAYSILKQKPNNSDIVVDLGASPGGWSYSAYLNGATVYSVDNGELKGGAKNNPKIIHYKTDAFKFMPDKRVDWLFCDIVEEPHHVLKLIEEWVRRKLCRFFIVNLKFGHADVMNLIKNIENSDSILKQNTSFFKLIHLFHDRDEVTLTGIVK
jgi:23S rRNA (cytidine2498-2'-O)-methyltransferase